MNLEFRRLFHPINVSNGKTVFVVRVNRSWIGPHRVIFQGHDKFYARNSAGKYSLDTAELRIAFTLSDTLVDRIKRFRTERVAELLAGNTAIPFVNGAKTMLHVVPLEAFSPSMRVDIHSIRDPLLKLRPIGSLDYGQRINLDGLLMISHIDRRRPPVSYVQLYRNGVVEAVEGFLMNYEAVIPSVQLEGELLEHLPRYLDVLKELGISLPILVFLSFTGTKGLRMSVDLMRNPNAIINPDRYVIDRDVLLLPESRIDSYDTDPEDILRPLFDLLWNACGFERSLNFEKNGRWIHRR